jgi:predicted phage tail component-like protein
MLEGIHFSYDGIKSVDMGLLNCKLDGGMFEETFLPSRELQEKKISGNDRPYFGKVSLQPLEFKLTFAFETNYDERKIREVARWLNQPYYKPFYTIDNPDRVFYAMLVGDSNLHHTGNKEGYIELTFRCDSPYSYTQTINKDNLVFSNTKIVKSVVEDTFNSGMGNQSNIKIDGSSNMAINIVSPRVLWVDFTGKKWSDL